ncbi:MAG: response regulator [Herpetosiphonaceae bacterium]|nr:response regulator [Herpetosiphonaceae bacterium]
MDTTIATRPVVLVVEDEPAIARLLEFQLREAGWEPVIAPDGLTALRLWSDLAPTLVLLDVMLPDLSGWEICAALRSESNVPIIMLTAKASDCDVVHGLNLGADDYLAKPFSNAQLLARIAAVLRRAHLSPKLALDVTPLQPHADPPLTIPATDQEPSQSGALLLREARQIAGMSLYAVERQLGIRWDYVQALEQGTFSAIPRPLLKNTMLRYCEFLNVDARPVFAQAQRMLLAHPETRRSIRPSMLILSATIILLIILPFFFR